MVLDVSHLRTPRPTVGVVQLSEDAGDVLLVAHTHCTRQLLWLGNVHLPLDGDAICTMRCAQASEGLFYQVIVVPGKVDKAR